MYEKILKIECKRGQYDTGEVIKINDEKWIATEVHYGATDQVVFQPFVDVVVKSSYIKLDGEAHPIRLADYIEDIIDNFRRNPK